ncbi:MAG: hypothetical protein Q9227_004164 [Pyrenula ochraceoflavens]
MSRDILLNTYGPQDCRDVASYGPEHYGPASHATWNSEDITKPKDQNKATNPRVKAPKPQCWPHRFRPFWGDVKSVAASGIKVIYGGPNNGSRQPAVQRRGIGIKWRNQNDTWNGLLNAPLDSLSFPLSWFGMKQDGMLKLPAMGMPPREPEKEMIEQARCKEDFCVDWWFKNASVIKATEWFDPKCITICDRETVIITISPAYEFEIGEAYEDPLRVGVQRNRKHWKYNKNNLYFIQLMPNELPSYVLFVNRDEEPCPVHDPGSAEFRRWGLVEAGQNVGFIELDEKGRVSASQRGILEQLDRQSLTQRLRSRSRSSSAENWTALYSTHRGPRQNIEKTHNETMRRMHRLSRAKSRSDSTRKIVPRFGRKNAPKLTQLSWT